MAAVETMMKRLDTGRWESTDPDQMKRARRHCDNSPARFTTDRCLRAEELQPDLGSCGVSSKTQGR